MGTQERVASHEGGSPQSRGSSPLPVGQTLPHLSTLYSSQGQVPAEEEAGGTQGRPSGSRETPEEPPGWQAHLTSCGGRVSSKAAFIGPGEGAGGRPLGAAVAGALVLLLGFLCSRSRARLLRRVSAALL